jgi:PIN domain nuclease of toxin-antitoxin system
MIVVDTHIIIWDALAPKQLSSPAAKALAQANQGDGFLISDISLWEIAMLIQKGRIKVNTDPQTFLTLIFQANNCQVRPITPEIAYLSVSFPNKFNPDPADRLIIATALSENVALITADQNIQSAGIVTTIW